MPVSTAKATEGYLYRQAWRWIECNPGTGSAISLAKLLLSLWNYSEYGIRARGYAQTRHSGRNAAAPVNLIQSCSAPRA